jgi:hypothetical protein
MEMMRGIFLVTVAILLSISAFAQKKYEKEYRVKPQDVPMEARQFVEAIQPQRKLKWYVEESLKGNSIEAKFVRGKRKYSIEFDTLGNLEDVEIEIDWDEIPEMPSQKMASNLDTTFSSATAQKIQVQYTGEASALLKLIQQEPKNAIYHADHDYELIVKGKKGKQKKLYEITFTQNGEMSDLVEIIFINTDNLEF